MRSPRSDERHIVCEVRCAPKDRQRLKTLMLRFVEPARLEEGCLYYDVFQDVEAPDTFYIIDGWTNEAAVAAHAASAHVAAVMDDIRPLLVFGPHLKIGLGVSAP